jgi:uncharacterized repeat protein (TIGR03803 family)
MARAMFILASLLLSTFTTIVHSQTLTVLHAFSGSPEGAYPYNGLTWDGKGNFYGTTSAGGNKGCTSNEGCGTVFKLARSGSAWVLTTLYRFQGHADGWEPFARVVFGLDGNLYGTTQYGGDPGTFGYGTIFKLTPPAPGCQPSCKWTHTVLYRFSGGSDGANPGVGDLVFDTAGNIYGTTESGGTANSACALGNGTCGVVFVLSPSTTGWSESVIYSFTGGSDGDLPIGGVTFDSHGNLFGTASEGGASGAYGTVFELTPSSSGWQEQTLHSFTGYADGAYSASSLLFDENSQTFYGTTSASLDGGGTVFQLNPSANGWTFETSFLFPFPTDPSGALAEHNGRLYGATPDGGPGFGNVFEMTSNAGTWTAKNLHSFTAQNDGESPEGNVVIDNSGNIYGTTSLAGANSQGVIYELTP